MTDIATVKDNVSKMLEQGAPASDIEAYVGSEGFTAEQLREHREPFQWREPPPSRPLIQEGLPVAGSVIGGMAGFPVGGILGSAVGTALGTSIGTSARDIARQLRADPQAARSPGEVARSQASEVIPQTAADLGGNLALRGLGKLAAPLVHKMFPPIPGTPEAQRLLQDKGGTLTAAQVSESPFISSLEDIARVGWFGKGEFQKLGVKNQEILGKVRADMVRDLTDIPAEKIARRGGLSFQDAVTKGEEAHQKAARTLYEDFATRSGAVQVNIHTAQAEAAAMVDAYERLGASPKGKLGEVLGLVTNAPKDISFSDAHFLRSQLDSIRRDLDKASDPNARALGMSKRLVQKMSESMDAAAKGLSSDLYKEYRQISDFYRRGKTAFQNDVLVDLMTKSPERVGETLLRAGNESEIIQARATLRQAARMDPRIDERQVWKNIQAGWLEAELTKKATQTAEGEVVGKHFMQDLAEGKSSRTFNAAFAAPERAAIRNFATAAFRSQEEPRIKGLSVLVPLIQGGAVGGILYGTHRHQINPEAGAGASAAILLTPKMLAKAMTNPRLVNMITEGMYMPATSKAAVPLLKAITEMVSPLREETPEASEVVAP